MANAEKEKRQAAEQAAQQAQDQLRLAMSNPPEQQQVQQTPKDIYEQMGLGPDDYPTVEQQKKIDAYRFQQQQQNFAQATNQQFVSTHPDFTDAAGQIDFSRNRLIPSAELQKILAEKPWKANAAYASAQGAYEIVMEERQVKKMQEQQKVYEKQQTQQEIDNKTAPMSGAAAGGGASVPVNQQAAALQTPQDVAAMEARVAAGELRT
jgi:hypothetical protein